MRYLLILLIVFFSGCSFKDYEKSQSKIIIIKSPRLKFADLGYIRNNDDEVEVELFVAGKSVEKISIDYLICTHEGCLSKSSFNKNFLHYSYPEDTLKQVLLGKEIYNSTNKIIDNDGFSQNIKNQYVDIRYRVSSKKIFFKDKKNNIIVKIKDTK
jgi:hypothetical protein